MLTRLAFDPPPPPILTGNPVVDAVRIVDQQLAFQRALAEYLSALNAPGIIAIESGSLNSSKVGETGQESGAFTTLSASGLTDLSGAAAGQIKFPETQNASTNVNTFDDYQEAPSNVLLSFSFDNPGDLSVSFASGIQLGRFTKAGNIAVLTFQLAASTFTYTTATGNLRITGIPFDTNAAVAYCGVCNYQGITLPAGRTQLGLVITTAEPTYISTRASGSGVSPVALTTAEIPSGSSLAINGFIIYNTP